MDVKIPKNLDYLFERYVSLLNEELGDLVYGVYIYGSIATGTYDYYRSDIDFMTVVKDELSEEDVNSLKSVHKKLLKLTPDAIKMEGEYVNLKDMVNGTPKKYPYFADGRLQEFVTFKYMSLHQVKEFGITIYGEDFNKIEFDLKWQDVENELKDRLDNYWRHKANLKATLLMDGWVAMVTLNVCRLFYALENRKFTSKVTGGEYALLYLPEEWHLIIKEALRLQKGTEKESVFSSRWQRRKKLKAFVNYMADSCKYYPSSCYFRNKQEN